RVQPGDVLLRARLHLREGFEAARLVGMEPELGLAIVVGRAQPAIHRRADMAAFHFVVSALLIVIGDAAPFGVPALLVAGDHAARREEAFADGPATLLGLAQAAPELVAHPWMLWPMVPAVRLVVRIAAIRNLIDQEILGHAVQSLPVRGIASA